MHFCGVWVIIVCPGPQTVHWAVILTVWVPAALVMQGLMDVGWMECEGWAAHSADIYQSKDTLCTVNLSLMHFIQNIQVPMNLNQEVMASMTMHSIQNMLVGICMSLNYIIFTTNCMGEMTTIIAYCQEPYYCSEKCTSTCFMAQFPTALSNFPVNKTLSVTQDCDNTHYGKWWILLLHDIGVCWATENTHGIIMICYQTQITKLLKIHVLKVL